jgi:hypothetical protein
MKYSLLNWYMFSILWRKEYLLYKQQWLLITKDQESKFRKFRERKCVIGSYFCFCLEWKSTDKKIFIRCVCFFSSENDTKRTNREHPAFRDDQSPFLKKLHNILLSYSFYNFDLGINNFIHFSLKSFCLLILMIVELTFEKDMSKEWVIYWLHFYLSLKMKPIHFGVLRVIWILWYKVYNAINLYFIVNWEKTFVFYEQSI